MGRFLILVKSPLTFLGLLVLCISCNQAIEGQNVPSPTVRTVSVLPTNAIFSLEEQQAVIEAEARVKISLPPASSAPAPSPPSVQFSNPLPPHQIFGFAPYWNLGMETAFPYQDLTTIAYFGLDVNPDGSINESANDNGWIGYQSQALVNMINQAHSNGDRVVLTITCFGNSNISQLISNPSTAVTLAQNVIPLITAKSFDGLNVDFEGEGQSIRAGLTRTITTIATEVHTYNPHLQVTVDTYGSSAEDPYGPFDIASLNLAVDGFFVMAYDMFNPAIPSPDSALSNWSPSDVEALATYVNTVSPSKIILGIPYYGYDWPTTTNTLMAPAAGSPTAQTYAQIVSQNHPVYWDTQTSTPWTSYQINGQWHETYYDDPASVALKVALASYYDVAGVGVWALGMDGNSPQMLAALLGKSSVIKDPLAGPPPTTNNNPSNQSSITSTTSLSSGTTTTCPNTYSSPSLTSSTSSSLPATSSPTTTTSVEKSTTTSDMPTTSIEGITTTTSTTLAPTSTSAGC
jgi:spore germination protein YaaH